MMDREFLQDLFSAFGPVSLRRMFSGYGVSVGGVNFALVLRGGIYFRADEQTVARFEQEGAKPFQYATRNKVVTVASYWQLPDRLYDDPEELADWAGQALGAAERAAATKRSRVARRTAAGAAKAPAGSAARARPKPADGPAKARTAKAGVSRKTPSAKRTGAKRPKAKQPKAKQQGTKATPSGKRASKARPQRQRRQTTTTGSAARKTSARKSKG